MLYIDYYILLNMFFSLGVESPTVGPCLHLEDYARKFDSYEQYAIAEFAEALLTIPKVLAINAALDAIDLVAALRTRHHVARTTEDPKKKEDFRWYGLEPPDLPFMIFCKLGVFDVFEQ